MQAAPLPAVKWSTENSYRGPLRPTKEKSPEQGTLETLIVPQRSSTAHDSRMLRRTSKVPPPDWSAFPDQVPATGSAVSPLRDGGGARLAPPPTPGARIGGQSPRRRRGSRVAATATARRQQDRSDSDGDEPEAGGDQPARAVSAAGLLRHRLVCRDEILRAEVGCRC